MAGHPEEARENWEWALTDGVMWHSFGVTALFVLLVVPVQLAAGLSGEIFWLIIISAENRNMERVVRPFCTVHPVGCVARRSAAACARCGLPAGSYP